MPFIPGFDDRWRDAPDFVAGVGRVLWEDRRLDRASDHLDKQVVQHDAAGTLRGPAFIAGVIESELAGFPDMRRLGEDTLWCPTGYKAFHASQRLLCSARHTGAGVFGAPTGRRLHWRVMQDAWCRNNTMAELWTLRDTGAILRQLGQTPQDFTRALIDSMGGPDACPDPLRPGATGGYDGKGNDNTWGHTLADLLTRIGAGDLSRITRNYDPAAEVAYAGGEIGSGPIDAQRFWLGLRAALPDGRLSVVHMTGMDEPLSPPRAAVRWWFSGTHDGWGRFGAPSGAPLDIMGITHAEFGPEGLRREWTLIDDVAVWQQILMARATPKALPEPIPSTPIPAEPVAA